MLRWMRSMYLAQSIKRGSGMKKSKTLMEPDVSKAKCFFESAAEKGHVGAHRTDSGSCFVILAETAVNDVQGTTQVVIWREHSNCFEKPVDTTGRK